VNDELPLDALDLILGEKEIIGSVAHSREEEFAWAVKYLTDGRIDLSPMITGRTDLSRAVEDGFRRLMRDRGQIKILVSPHAGEGEQRDA
jgi:(R,R)-butanediol dehydrogenase / meso-butanediol dehydrogenase / diacetyl reductase